MSLVVEKFVDVLRHGLALLGPISLWILSCRLVALDFGIELAADCDVEAVCVHALLVGSFPCIGNIGFVQAKHLPVGVHPVNEGLRRKACHCVVDVAEYRFQAEEFRDVALFLPTRIDSTSEVVKTGLHHFRLLRTPSLPGTPG